MTWVQKAGSAEKAYEIAKKRDPEAELKVSKIGKDRYLVETTYKKGKKMHTYTEDVKRKRAAESYQERYPETSLETKEQAAKEAPPPEKPQEQQKAVAAEKTTVEPKVAYEAGLISQREYEHGIREDLIYETTPENLEAARQAKSMLKSEYPEAQVSPGITPFQKLYALEGQRSEIIQNLISNPIVRASYVFDKDILGIETVSEYAVSKLAGGDWEAKRQEMMVSYSEELLERKSAIEAGALAAAKTGAVTAVIAASGGVAGTKVGVVASTAMKVTYGAALGTQYGENIKTVTSQEATGQEKAESIARSFVYSVPLMVAGATKITRPLAQKTISWKPRGGRTMKGTVGTSKKGRTKQQTKSISKSNQKKVQRAIETTQALEKGQAKIIKVQTKRGLEKRIVWERKTPGEKQIDRMFRKMTKDYKAKKNVYLVDQNTYNALRRQGFIDQGGRWTTKGKAAIQMQKIRTGQDYSPGDPFRGYPKHDVREPPPLKWQRPPTWKGPKLPKERGTDWWKRQVAARERIAWKQKIPKPEYERRLATKNQIEKLENLVKDRPIPKEMEVVALSSLVKKMKKVEDVRAVPVSIYDIAQDQSQREIQDILQVQEQVQIQEQAGVQAVEPAITTEGSGISGRRGGVGPGPPSPGPSPPPPVPKVRDFVPKPPRPERPSPSERIRKPPEYIPPIQPKMPWLEFPREMPSFKSLKNIKPTRFKYTYTASLVGTMRLIKPVWKPPLPALKGFGFRPMLTSWLPSGGRKKSKKRRKR